MSSDSPAAILFDESGNPVGVTFDGYVYRLQTQATITDGYNGPVAVTPPFTAAIASDPALVVALSPNSPITTTTARPFNNSSSSIASSTSSILLLASNSIRLGATIYNDSAAFLYVKLGGSVSFNDFTIKLFPGCYYEVPYRFAGEIDGLWSTANGFARISEFT